MICNGKTKPRKASFTRTFTAAAVCGKHIKSVGQSCFGREVQPDYTEVTESRGNEEPLTTDSRHRIEFGTWSTCHMLEGFFFWGEHAPC